ncbi:BrxE family protein [Acidovorax sp. Root217]|uniref:BrxE family protein n=1 Tax=Acidovorax sp. Root217 TaxID=1736492 RepID=UPI001F36FEEC|nr:BrxE family protein [Acidovorax sp. Root217]
MKDQMDQKNLSLLLQIRLVVGVLGERNQFAWWPTSFYDQSSRLFLDPVFSKTHRLAQYHGTLEAARRLHDEHLNAGSYHLFRLPEEVEQDLHTLVQSGVEDGLISSAGSDQLSALNELKKLAKERPQLIEGPIAFGSAVDIEAVPVLKEIAGAYLSAFKHNTKTYPYFVG